MAKNLLLNILVDVLGKFVDGLAVENLKVGVFSGKIELKNLKLKTSALEDINLPVTITHGSLKHLNLKIPWTSLESKPVQVVLDGLLLQLGPFEIHKVDAAVLRKAVLDAKHKALLKVEDAILQTAMINRKEDANYMQKLAVKIIDNIEVSISNVHIRFEDVVPQTDCHFSAGCTLEALSISTTDGNWKEKFVTRDAKKGKSDTIQARQHEELHCVLEPRDRSMGRHGRRGLGAHHDGPHLPGGVRPRHLHGVHDVCHQAAQ